MKKLFLLIVLLFIALGSHLAGSAEPAGNSDQLEHDFHALPMSARSLTGPLFWLHGDESRERLEQVLTKVLEGGNGCFTAESRPHNDWLGPGWRRDLQICLDFAKRHGLAMWIFDEKWWPSGEVGGRVPRQYASKRLVGRAVSASKAHDLEVREDRLVAVLAGRSRWNGIDGESLQDLTGLVRDGRLEWRAPEGRWKVMVFTWDYAPRRRGSYLVDGASREAVKWYLDTVYQPHYDWFGEDFGKTIKGFFYDEPETPGDWGTEVIPLLKERGVDWKKALVAWKFRLAGEEQTAAYYQYQDAKAEAWGRTMYGGITEWCHEHGVSSIGHWLEHSHEYLWQNLCAGNLFQLEKYSDLGGIDLVYKQLPPGKRPMGIYQIAKLASSVSHVYGKPDDLAMVEIFGARGQDLPYSEMKWQTDHMQVRGVNFLIPHSFNPRAPKDDDCPPYFYNGGFEPRFPLYRVFADYTSRLSLMLSGGRHVAPVAFLFLGNSKHVGHAVTPERLTSALQDALFDCDWMPYDVFTQDAELAGQRINLHQESYRVLIVPPVEVIPYEALQKARDFFESGGVVMGYGFLPSKSATLGRSGADIKALRQAIWGPAPLPGLQVKRTSAAGGRSYFLPLNPSPEQLQEVLTEDAGIHPGLEVVQGKTNHWVHVLHRVKEGRHVFFITNQNLKPPARSLVLRVRAPGEPEVWDAMRDEITRPAYRRLGPEEVEVSLTLEPYESALLVFNPEQRSLPPRLEPGDQALMSIAVTRDPEEPGPSTPPAPIPRRHPGLTVSPVRADPFHGRFEVPADLDRSTHRLYLVCDEIAPERAARVSINGRDAGGFLEAPLRLPVTSLITAGENTVTIEPFAPHRAWIEVYDNQ